MQLKYNRPVRSVSRATSLTPWNSSALIFSKVRDDRFHTKDSSPDAGDETEDDWMSVQVLATVHGTEKLHEEQKQEVRA